MKIKKATLRNGTFLFVCIVLFLGIKILFTDSAYAACSGTDTFSINVHSPTGSLIKTSSVTIDNVAGTDCDQGDTDNDNTSVYIYCQESGNYTANITCTGCSGTNHNNLENQTVLLCEEPEDNKLVIQGPTGSRIAAFDEKGYVYLTGLNFSNQASLSPTPKSYVIQNNAGTVVAYINSTGSLFVTGDITNLQTITTAPVNSFVIQNRTGNVVSYIDSSGNLVLTGKIYFNWTGGI